MTAEQDYHAATLIRPDNLDALNHLAMAQQKQGKDKLPLALSNFNK